MQQFRADLHIHSRYSRATSTKLTPRALAAWGMVKGLTVLGTGDFTHAKWRQELADALTFDEASGLYRVTDPRGIMDVLPEYAAAHAEEGQQPPLFMLQGEISSIYKRDGQVRKVHNLVYMPNLEAAERLCRRLELIGNLASDGRPILGLDSRNLLEMVLETDPRAFLIPAHIWTPWFSLFGSKSGFDSIEACFGDLTPEIFALETGLSSDPDMNRLWSSLDRFKLVSNSDAHSGENLGREANLFAGEASYVGMYHALKDNTGPCRFLGTLEFFPEEGKYHLDGHRACNVMLEPQETRALNGLCPVCGKPLTVGVLHRVMALADRSAPVHPPEQQFLSLIPLPELIGEIIGTGAKSKKVAALHAKAVARFGSELALLQDAPLEEITRFFTPLGEAVARMRRGEVIRQGGYDGEYGVVTVFSEEEQREIRHGSLLPGGCPMTKPRAPRTRKNAAAHNSTDSAAALPAKGAASGGTQGTAIAPETVTRRRATPAEKKTPKTKRS